MHLVAPCALPEGNTSQLEERLALGYHPHISLRESLPRHALAQVAQMLNDSSAVARFNLQDCSAETAPEDYRAAIESVAEIVARAPGNVLPSLGLKAGRAVHGQATLLSPIGAAELQSFWERTKDLLSEMHQLASGYDLRLEFENPPQPNFGRHPSLPVDPSPRWSGKWSPVPVFDGAFSASSKDIAELLGSLPDAQLQLDIEHLVQTVEYGHVFAIDGGPHRRLVGDLEPQQLSLLERYGERDPKEVLFDYEGMSDSEHSFLHEHGYTVRKGQPLVYDKRLSFRRELDAVLMHPITTITPGFQVYQLIHDDGPMDAIPRIGSHMPGIHPRYVHAHALREELLDKVACIHQYLWQRVRQTSIEFVELEPQIDGGAGPVYGGAVWAEHMRFAADQLRELQDRPTRHAPEYF